MAQTGLLGTVRVEDEQVFDDLLIPLVQPGYRLACAMLHDPHAAEDVVQEASITAWRKLRNLDDRSHLRGWFLGIVANECRNARRKRWLTRVTIGLSGRLSVASTEDKVVRSTDLRRALMSLSLDDRMIVALFFFLDLPLDEVAQAIGCSEAAARSKLYRAIRRMKPDIDPEVALR